MTLDELETVIDGWLRDPQPDLILQRLSSSPDRYSLATLLIEHDLTAMPDIVLEQIKLLLDSDPLSEAVADLLFTAAVDAIPLTAADLGPLCERILARPDRDAYQALLVDDIVEYLDDEDQEDSAIKARVADAAVLLADRLPHPDFALVYLTHAEICPTPTGQARSLDRSWARAELLPPEVRFHFACEISYRVDATADPELAIAVTAVALETGAEIDPGLIPGLQGVRGEALAASDPIEAISYLDAVLSAGTLPAELVEDFADAWFELVVLGLANNDEHPPARVLSWIEQLARHRERWPDEDPEYVAIVEATIGRAYLVRNHPELAGTWIEQAWARHIDDPDAVAEIAMLRVRVSHQLGQMDEALSLLREAAPFVRDGSKDEPREEWWALTEAFGQTFRDDLLMKPSWDVSAPASRRLEVALNREILTIHHAFLAAPQATGRESLNRLLALRQTIPNDLPAQQASTMLYGAFAAIAIEENVVATDCLTEMGRTLERERRTPSGGFSIAGLEALHQMAGFILRIAQSGYTADLRDDIRAARDDHVRDRRTLFAYLLTQSLMILLARAGEHAAAVQEGISALAFHTRRATAVPDARERTMLRNFFHTIVSTTVQSALACGQRQVVAEVLEIARAQPIPTARDEVPDAEQSLLRLATAMFQPALVPDGFDWADSWSTSEPIAAGADEPRSQVEETELLLSGLPAIRFPWGLALDNQLGDPAVDFEVEVVVPRLEL